MEVSIKGVGFERMVMAGIDMSYLAISKTVSEKAKAEATSFAKEDGSPNETLFVKDDADITGPLMFIGGGGGSRYQMQGWNNGKVITRIRVYSGESMIKAYTIWLTDEDGTTYGQPDSCDFAEYAFQPGELITKLTLWGNGAGTRAGWIEFETSLNKTFSYGMYGWPKKTAYPVDVASGILVGYILNAGSDIDAHGFWLLNAIDNAQLINVSYPTLDFGSAGIIPKVLDRFQDTNDTNTPIDWEFGNTVSEGTEQSWSTTVDLTYHATISVKAGIPEVGEVSGEYGWQVGDSSTYQTTQTSTQELSWLVKGTLQPGDNIDIKAVTRMGSLGIEYDATMFVTLKNGAAFAYSMSGTYTGISYTGVEIVNDS